MRTAIDTNILSALWSGEEGSERTRVLLNRDAARGGLVICPLVYAELRACPRASGSFVDDFLDRTGIVVEWECDRAIWRLAADRFEKYAVRKRKQGMGEPKRLLVDYVVGAHALLRADQLLTLDKRLYRRDFGELPLNP